MCLITGTLKGIKIILWQVSLVYYNQIRKVGIKYVRQVHFISSRVKHD